MTRPALSRDQVREIDRRAIEEFGLPGIVLMENAGRGCAEILLREKVSGPIAIFAGKGNNGGDGFVIARHLDNAGIPVTVYLTNDPSEFKGDAAVHFQVIQRADLKIIVLKSSREWDELRPALAQADWIVDALLGTGFAGTPREPIASAIRAINASGRRVLAVDLPSGLDAETGQAAGDCVHATHTATFVALKNGMVKADRRFLGELEIVDIGVPRSLLTRYGDGQELR
jgi:NAD(P)H-hydrate epimerase